MIKPTPAEIIDDELVVVLNNKAVQLSIIDAIRLRLTLNSFINGDLEEAPEDEE